MGSEGNPRGAEEHHATEGNRRGHDHSDASRTGEKADGLRSAGAEGDKRAKILAAEAEKETQIALAEGRAKSIELVYQAEAEGLKLLNDANPNGNALKLKGIDALKQVSNGQATKIYVPTDIMNSVATLGVTGEALGIVDKTPIKEPGGNSR